VKDLDRDDIARRVQDAREDVTDARDDAARTRAEQYLAQLTTLQSALQAA
jgi:F-type H+-transporting ATPase subunit epsilon